MAVEHQFVGAQVVHWYGLYSGAKLPQRADKSALGTLSTRAFRYCDAVTLASGFGWYVFPPIPFALLYTGKRVYYQLPGMDEFSILDEVGFPDLTAEWRSLSPDCSGSAPPPFLSCLREPGMVQISSGLILETRPGWSSFLRRPANVLADPGYDVFEAIVETDRWLGPLFTNINITLPNEPIVFQPDRPLFQVSPIPRSAYSEPLLNAPTPVKALSEWSESDWARFVTGFSRPALDANRKPGRYAREVRKRRALEGGVLAGAH